MIRRMSNDDTISLNACATDVDVWIRIVNKRAICHPIACCQSGIIVKSFRGLLCFDSRCSVEAVCVRAWCIVTLCYGRTDTSRRGVKKFIYGSIIERCGTEVRHRGPGHSHGRESGGEVPQKLKPIPTDATGQGWES